MIDRAPRLLFVPVSGPFGMGEYARSLALAHAAAARWPGAAVRFVLSREASYGGHAPFPATLLASSPTFHSAAVIEIIEQWRPDLVVFDNAGRSAQLRAAKRAGARVIYISARRRQRSKAFRLRWMRLIDEHWIAYPRFVAGPLSFLERFKLRLVGRPVVRYLDVILTAPTPLVHDPNGGALGQVRGAARGLRPSPGDAAPGSYVLVVPGGGTGHPGAGTAVGNFLGAARGLAAAGVDTVYVGPAGPDNAAAHLRIFGPLPQADLAALMRGARLIIANGGSTLLQSMACGKPCIAAPIAADQSQRIERCVRVGAARRAALDTADILRVATQLWGDEAQLETLAGRSIALGLADGLEVALRAMDTLLATGH